MLAAKDDDTQRASKSHSHAYARPRYITLVDCIAMDEGAINTGIARSTRDRVRWRFRRPLFPSGHYDL
ncbi:MAG: hypothetical protein ACLU0O_00885 [Collinsella sp.]